MEQTKKRRKEGNAKGQPQAVRREYKDRLFKRCFREKEELLNLYNAVNGSCYTNPEELEITTLEDAVYLSMVNDLSFILSWDMNLYEQQSTCSPNMPLRGLLYFARLYEAYITENNLDVYGEKALELPRPHFIVFYNGAKEKPDESYASLSALFKKEEAVEQPAALECVARMLNINYGHNMELLDSCKRLHDYSYFIEAVKRRLREGNHLEDAVNEAIEECIRNDILSDLLEKSRSEVFDMLLTEYATEIHERHVFENGREDGMLAARQEDILELLEDLGAIPQELQGRICAEEDVTVLSKWLKLAARAESIADFERKIKEKD